MKQNSLCLGLVVLGVMAMLLLLQSLDLATAIAGDVPDNLALRGFASADSVHELTPIPNASMINDGLSVSHWIGGLSDYKRGEEQFPHRNSWWVQIDLGKVTEVGAVAFGGESKGRTPKDFTIQVSTDGINYSDWKKVTGRTDPARIMYDGNPAQARYVKVIITDINGPREGGYSPGIGEIEIYSSVEEAKAARVLEKPKKVFVAEPEPEYAIWREGATYYAKDTKGEIPPWGKGPNPSKIINAVIDAMDKGRILLRGNGQIWDIPEKIILKDGITVEGSGFGVGNADTHTQPVTLRTDGSDELFYYDSRRQFYVAGISIRNIQFIHTGKGPHSVIYIRGGQHSLFENIEINNGPDGDFTNAAFKIEGGENYWLKNIYIYSCPKAAIYLGGVGRTILDNIILDGDNQKPDPDSAALVLNACSKISVINSQVTAPGGTGIRAYRSGGLGIINTIFWPPGDKLPNTRNDINIEKTAGVTILACRFEAGPPELRTRYALDIDSESKQVIVAENAFGGEFGSGVINNKGKDVKVHHNVGFDTEVAGKATFPKGKSSYTFAHGLDGPPTHVSISWQEDIGGRNWYWAEDSGNITITMNSPATNEIDFSYYAVYQP